MARKTKSDEAPDAAEETQAEVTEAGAEATEELAPETKPEAEAAVENPEIVEMAEPAEESRSADDEEPTDVAATVSETEATPVSAPEPQVVRKGGFFPMLLGGVAAAAIGAGVAFYAFPDGAPWSQKTASAEADLVARLDALESDIAALKSAQPDLAPLEAQIQGVGEAGDSMNGRITEIAQQLGDFESRITTLEKRPITEAASPEAVAAYERELKALQAAMAAQRAEAEKLADEAAQKEANAELTAQQAMQRAAASRILTALDTGNGYADAVADLAASGIAVPPALTQHATAGVATTARLTQEFPEAARAALAVARKADSGGGFAAFLKNQFGARSLEPREGADADAVLSRAEAAVNEGRLKDAVAELDALPEVARAEMSDWLGKAATRIAVLSAAEKLAAEMN